MISQETARAVLATLIEWADDNDVEPEAMQDLAERFTKIKGNKSYEQSVAVIALLVKEIAES